jgi:hypothetical protein
MFVAKEEKTRADASVSLRFAFVLLCVVRESDCNITNTTPSATVFLLLQHAHGP